MRFGVLKFSRDFKAAHKNSRNAGKMNHFWLFRRTISDPKTTTASSKGPSVFLSISERYFCQDVG
jgi:hypothetical protein